MAASSTEKTKETTGVSYMVLALGLLIGFVIGFVMLLSSLPVDDSLTSFNAREAVNYQVSTPEYKFYEILPEKVVPAAQNRTTGRTENRALVANPVANLPLAPEVVVSKPNRVITPATRVVPANAQTLNNGYTEVPANFRSQSFYLQAGKFAQPAEAEAMRAQVLLLGLQAFIVTREEPGAVIRHRVRVGPYQDQGMLTEAKKRLRRGGVRYDVVRVTSG